MVTETNIKEVLRGKCDGALSVSMSPGRRNEKTAPTHTMAGKSKAKDRDMSMPPIRPEVFHVFGVETTLSVASDTTSKTFKRKRQMKRIRSLSREDREEALVDVHVIPLVTERVVEQVMS